MSKQLAGKTAVVTGSTSGIGRAIAMLLAAEGANVMLNGFGDGAQIEALRAGLERDHGVKARFHGADMAKPAEIAELVKSAQSQLGAVDILVNNAGIQYVAPVDEFPDERWDAIIAINLSAAFHTMQAALPGMAARGFGRVVNIASVHGLVASVQKAPYVAAKFGLVGMSKVAALEYASSGSRDSGGVTVNCICPGWVETPLIEPQIEARRNGGSRDDGVRALLSEKQPSLRMSMPDDIAALATWLCRREAHNMTGAAIPVDGGWTAQ